MIAHARFIVVLLVVCGCDAPSGFGPAVGRITLSLNGTWEAAEGTLDESPPASFAHRVPVPGLLTSADPPFEGVGDETSDTQAYWLRTTFEAPPAGDVAELHFYRAKYGIAVWVNGTPVGEHYGAFTRARLSITDALIFGQTNELLVRVGAHRGSVPRSVPSGQDAEKERWIPGLYDDVEVVISSTPRVASLRTEPDIEAGAVHVVARVVNDRPLDREVTVTLRAVEHLSGDSASDAVTTTVFVPASSELEVRATLALHDPRRWSPSDPFLYEAAATVAELDAVLDETSVRFGLREVEWRAAAPGEPAGFFLNGERMILRGSNITLHRFFEDPAAGTQPWNEEWVRSLLRDNPRDLDWNVFRFCVGRAPRAWYDIADELGMLVVDERMQWTLTDGGHLRWSEAAIRLEMEEWIEEAVNHPSIILWDAANETSDPRLADVLDTVRALDPTRQWELGGFNAPHRPGDPIEDHPYLFSAFHDEGTMDPLRIEMNDGLPPQGGIPGQRILTHDDPTHPYILNEYGWFWIDREGRPTVMSEPVFEEVVSSERLAAEENREAYAYYVAGLTEHWRAHRGYAAVMHFTYLGYSRSGGHTSDNFVDVQALELEPRWREYARHAFAPMGVYLGFWRDRLEPGEAVSLSVTAFNDHPTAQNATVEIVALGVEGAELFRGDAIDVALPAYGAVTEAFAFIAPVEPHVIFAVMTPEDPAQRSVVSRRKVGFEHVGRPGPLPPSE